MERSVDATAMNLQTESTTEEECPRKGKDASSLIVLVEQEGYNENHEELEITRKREESRIEIDNTVEHEEATVSSNKTSREIDASVELACNKSSLDVNSHLTIIKTEPNISDQTVSIWPFHDLSMDLDNNDSSINGLPTRPHDDGDGLYMTYPIQNSGLGGIEIFHSDIKRISTNDWLNDSLIDLKIMFFVESRYDDVEWYSRFHVFSGLFFPALVSAIKRKISLLPRWTKSLDLFSKDFILIPICCIDHWSLCVVVRPKQWLLDTYHNQIEQENEKEKSMGCILFMDSLNLHNYQRDAKIVQLYFSVEWKRKNYKDASIRNSNEETLLDRYIDSNPNKNLFSDIPVIRCTSAPQQTNGFDCGMFVTKYAELMLTMLPTSTQSDLELNFGNHMNQSSFSQNDISIERQDFLHQMAEKRSQWIAFRQNSEVVGDSPNNPMLATGEPASVVDTEVVGVHLDQPPLPANKQMLRTGEQASVVNTEVVGVHPEQPQLPANIQTGEQAAVVDTEVVGVHLEQPPLPATKNQMLRTGEQASVVNTEVVGVHLEQPQLPANIQTGEQASVVDTEVVGVHLEQPPLPAKNQMLGTGTEEVDTYANNQMLGTGEQDDDEARQNAQQPALVVELHDLVKVGTTLIFSCEVNFQLPALNLLLNCGSPLADTTEVFLFYAANTRNFNAPLCHTDAIYAVTWDWKELVEIRGLNETHSKDDIVTFLYTYDTVGMQFLRLRPWYLCKHQDSLFPQQAVNLNISSTKCEFYRTLAIIIVSLCKEMDGKAFHDLITNQSANVYNDVDDTFLCPTMLYLNNDKGELEKIEIIYRVEELYCNQSTTDSSHTIMENVDSIADTRSQEDVSIANAENSIMENVDSIADTRSQEDISIVNAEKAALFSVFQGNSPVQNICNTKQKQQNGKKTSTSLANRAAVSTHTTMTDTTLASASTSDNTSTSTVPAAKKRATRKPPLLVDLSFSSSRPKRERKETQFLRDDAPLTSGRKKQSTDVNNKVDKAKTKLLKSKLVDEDDEVPGGDLDDNGDMHVHYGSSSDSSAVIGSSYYDKSFKHNGGAKFSSGPTLIEFELLKQQLSDTKLKLETSVRVTSVLETDKKLADANASLEKERIVAAAQLEKERAIAAAALEREVVLAAERQKASATQLELLSSNSKLQVDLLQERLTSLNTMALAAGKLAAEKEQLAKDQEEMKHQQLLDKIAFLETNGFQMKVLETKIALADAYEIKIAAERKTVQANTVDNFTKAAEFFAVGAKTQTDLVGKLVCWNAQSTQTAVDQQKRVSETVSYAHNIVTAQQSQQAESQRQQHQQQAEDQKQQLSDLLMKKQLEEQKLASEAKRRKEKKRKATEAEIEAAKKQLQMLQDLLIVDDDSDMIPLEKQY